jgi:hypothetical protein
MGVELDAIDACKRDLRHRHKYTMATLQTIPDDEAALLAKPETKATGLKKIVGGAAVAAFVFGMLAATAVTSHAHRAPANLSAVDWQCRPQGGSTGYSKWCPAQNECVRPWEYPGNDFKKYCEKKPQKTCFADSDWNWHGCDSKHRCKPDGGGDADTGRCVSASSFTQNCWWSQDGKTHGCDVDLRCDRDWEPFMSTLENPLERNHKGPVGKI